MKFERDKDGKEFKMKGKSNLYPQLLIDDCVGLCLVHDSVKTHQNRLKLLVERRNAIAHGKKLTIKDLDAYMEFEVVTLDVMCSLAIAIVTALNEGHYLEPIPDYHI